MNWDEYKNYLLSAIPGAKIASGGKLINCRCRECADGKSATSKHFYISIPYDTEEPSMYYCHKCNCKGYVDHKKLIAWGIYNQEIAIALTKYNEEIFKNPRASKYSSNQVYQVRHTYTTDDNKSEEKRQYLVRRLGYELNFTDLNNLKIILNLNDFLQENNIDKITRNQNVVNDLDREFIGFLSIDNAYFNMRRTCEEGLVYKEIDKRYVNYNIFNKMNTNQRFYTIPTVVNLNSYKRIKLHISEGPMDILSIYLNLRNKEEGIYTSIAGNNYINIILYFLIDLKLPYLEIHLYPDNDKYGTLDRMKYIKSLIPDPTIPVIVHKNIFPGEKDFGVPKNKITESIIPI